METTTIKTDITLLCAKAESFPNGVLAAFQLIENAAPEFKKRDFYGLSRGNREGGIDYWAAVEQKKPEEPEKTGFESKTIRSGKYATLKIKDFRKNIPEIGQAFTKLLTLPEMDPNTFCLEKYENDTVKCMVRLKDHN